MLNPVEGRAIEDGFVLALEPLAAVVNLANIDAVLEEVGEGTVGKGNGSVVFRDFGVPSLGNNAPSVQIRDELAERLQFDVATENGSRESMTRYWTARTSTVCRNCSNPTP